MIQRENNGKAIVILLRKQPKCKRRVMSPSLLQKIDCRCKNSLLLFCRLPMQLFGPCHLSLLTLAGTHDSTFSCWGNHSFCRKWKHGLSRVNKFRILGLSTVFLQCAKKVVSDSLGLVDFAIGLVIFVLNLPDGQVLFFGEIHITEGL